MELTWPGETQEVEIMATDNLVNRNRARIPAAELPKLAQIFNGRPSLKDIPQSRWRCRFQFLKISINPFADQVLDLDLEGIRMQDVDCNHA